MNDLVSLDPEMHKNLMFLKDYPNVEELALNFTIVEDVLGERQVKELIPGGKVSSLFYPFYLPSFVSLHSSLTIIMVLI